MASHHRAGGACGGTPQDAERLPPAVRQPVADRPGIGGGHGVQHHVLVIADQVDHREPAGRVRPWLAKHGHDSGAVRAAIDEISEMDDARRGDRAGGEILADQPVHVREPVRAAVDVADRIDALVRGQARRR